MPKNAVLIQSKLLDKVVQEAASSKRQ